MVYIRDLIKDGVPGFAFALVSLLELITGRVESRSLQQLHVLLLLDAYTDLVNGGILTFVFLVPILAKFVPLAIVSMFEGLCGNI